MSLLINEEDFIEVYNKYVDTVYKVCYMYYKNKSDTEDAVQTTFIKLLENKKSFENYEHVKAWLIVTASNICKNSIKHWYQRIMHLENEEEIPSEKPTNELLNAVLNLPEKYKLIIYMYYYEGYNSREIAKALNKNESTIRTYLMNGRDLLKDDLGGNYEE
jgi:RNA polymerase sigma-70 factor (ECF subfamily)